MLGKTHLLGGFVIGLAIVNFLPNADLQQSVAIVAGAALGSLLPDADHPQSMINGIIPFLRWTSLIVGHRGALHGLFIPLILISTYWTSEPFFYVFNYFVGMSEIQPIVIPIWVMTLFPAIGIGWLSHILLDALTPRGVPLFYPIKRPINLLPRLISIRTGGFLEFIFSIGLYILLASQVAISLGLDFIN